MRRERWLPKLVWPLGAILSVFASIADGFGYVFGKRMDDMFP